MSGLKKAVFGSPSKSETTTNRFFGGTNFSNVKGGIVNLDPSIRNLQETGIANFASGNDAFRGALGSITGQLGELRTSLTGNQSPFLDARTAPLRRQFAEQRGALARDLGRRGVGGSSFASQAQTRQAVEQGEALSNQRALAMQESINAGMSIDQMLMQAAQLENAGSMAQAEFLRSVAADRANVETGLLTAAGTNSKSTGASKGLLDYATASFGGGGGTTFGIG